jgi:hypothetical protein
MDDLIIQCESQMAPVTYGGTIAGRPFFFRARWHSWYFAVANKEEELYGDEVIFSREGDYGTDYEASMMPLPEAEAIIRQCAQEYLTEMGQQC